MTTDSRDAGVLAELVDPSAGASLGTVIWLHGMGHDPGTMRKVAGLAGLVGGAVRHVYVEAPLRNVGLLRPTPVRAWMVQKVTQLDSTDLRELRSTTETLRVVIDREADRLGSDKVMLAGFSQGAAMSLMLALTHHRRLAGVAVYAPFMLRVLHTRDSRFQDNRGIPIWLGHGQEDWTIPIEVGRSIRDSLLKRGYDVQWREYPGGHEPFFGAESDLARFITSVLGVKGPP